MIQTDLSIHTHNDFACAPECLVVARTVMQQITFVKIVFINFDAHSNFRSLKSRLGKNYSSVNNFICVNHV